MNESALSDPWLALAVAVFVVLVLAITLWGLRARRPAASTDAKLDALDRRLGAAEKKWAETDHDVRNIRQIVGNLPTKESINAIAVQVAKGEGKIDGMATTLLSQTSSLTRIEDFLMKVSAEAIVSNKATAAATSKTNGDQS